MEGRLFQGGKPVRTFLPDCAPMRGKIRPRAYATIAMPMERAVLDALTAASTEAALRSGIFCFAISRTWASKPFPPIFVGRAGALGQVRSFLQEATEAGVSVKKVKVRSA